ncbi:DUF4124 domain-containing protein [Marilutibacter spongiae]|uniref:DUF4124 domain-containing protein n=1 Tax=Marilutibacter spongiae TaxID=2025720 RepID=A0A7W3TMZ9_9GAMM|nr:DUF4124 domain-containing protein [Lysobacter spongiae]MBB1061316.1 DUF4124 domain-containing protein [Lysobacter spongiae]
MPRCPSLDAPGGARHSLFQRATRPLILAGLASAVGVAMFATGPTQAQTTLYRCTDAGGNLTIQSAPCPAGTDERKQVVNDLPSAPPVAPRPASTLPEPEWQIAPEPAAAPPAPSAVLAPKEAPAPDPAAMPTPGQPIVRAIPLETRSDGIGVGGESISDFQLLDSGTPLAERAPDADADAHEADGDEATPLPPLYDCRTWDNDRYFGDLAEPPPRCAPLQTVGIGGNPGIGAGSACEMRDDSCSAVPDDGLCDAWLHRLRDEQAKLVFARSDDPAATRAEVGRIEGLIRASRCR